MRASATQRRVRTMDSASARDALAPAALRSSARMLLISSPVLIFTGHFSWHMPSAAQVASPWYEYAARIVSSLARANTTHISGCM